MSESMGGIISECPGDFIGIGNAIVDACCDAWNKLTNQPEIITSIATREWALQVKL